MTALLLGIFVASLAGSMHCAGMCGALATVSCAGCSRAQQQLGAIGAYHLARAATYALAGAICGSVGGALDLGGGLVGVHRLAGVVAGAAVVLAGVALLMRHGGFGNRARAPRAVERLLASGHRAAMGVAPLPRGAMIGALSVMLPCGWLWAFLAVAAGTGTWIGGALAMVAFWAGSVPVLSVVGVGAGRVGALARGRVAVLMGVAMIAIGMHSAWLAGARSEAVEARRVEVTRATLEQAANEVPACCLDEEPAP